MPRYVYRPEHPRASHNGFVDVRDLGDFQDKPATLPVVIDRHYWGLKATDGADIGSRKKHREYMHKNGLTTCDDYDKPGGEWERAEKYREKIRAGDVDHKERRETIGRIAYEMEMGRHARRR